MPNTSYYLYQKYFKIGDQDWLPCYPVEYAISGNTGQNPVVKQENDPNCGYCTPEYRWEIASIDDAYICSAGTKYYKEYYQVSTDCGFNWSNVVPEQSRKGDIYESGSSDCIEYRWTDIDISEDYICDECPEAEYRWTATTGYVCSGTDKMTKEIEQYSIDSGTTWHNVSPEVSRAALPMIESASTDCGYIPPTPPTPDYSKQYLTFIPVSGTSTFKHTSGSSAPISYSLDSGLTWTVLANNTNSPTVNAGNKIMWKGELVPNAGEFSSSNKFIVEGNAMSLVYADDFVNNPNDRTFSFQSLFSGCTGLTSAENLVLPATTLGQNNYAYMFLGCTNLTTAPITLSATTLAVFCYGGMFSGCTSLTAAPELPATTLAIYCYTYMFQDCTSLTTAPSLPATTLANDCYEYMFNGCTSLTTAPVLSATTLASDCYVGMFGGCTSLATAPSLPATTLANDCYNAMFNGCTSLTASPLLPAATLVNGCYAGMFKDCSSLSNVTCLATDISASGCITWWLRGVASTGTFTKASGMTSWTTTTTGSGIPTKWTVQNYSS